MTKLSSAASSSASFSFRWPARLVQRAPRNWRRYARDRMMGLLRRTERVAGPLFYFLRRREAISQEINEPFCPRELLPNERARCRTRVIPRASAPVEEFQLIAVTTLSTADIGNASVCARRALLLTGKLFRRAHMSNRAQFLTS